MITLIDNPTGLHPHDIHEYRLIDSHGRELRFYCKWCLTVVKVTTPAVRP